MALTWLRGDLHCHCERHELLPALLKDLPARVDFLALTNHPHKPIFAEQAAMLARAREACPTVAFFFGVEWNGVGGRHTNVIFPPSPREAQHAAAFIQAHDYQIAGREPDLQAAFAHLQALPAAERPIVFLNHPSAAVGFTADHLAAFDAAAPDPALWIGLEGLHGHQAWPHVLADDPTDYPASRLNGLVDQLAARGRRCAVLSDSDFHVHKQASKPDYPPGYFQHTRLALDPAAPAPATPAAKAAAVFAALRAAATAAHQGHWCDLPDCTLDPGDPGDSGDQPPRTVRPGATIDTRRAVTLRIHYRAAEPLRRIEALGALQPGRPAAVLFHQEHLPAGAGTFACPLPAGARGFLRLRLTALQDARPAIPNLAAALPPAAPRLILTAPWQFAPEESPR